MPISVKSATLLLCGLHYTPAIGASLSETSLKTLQAFEKKKATFFSFFTTKKKSSATWQTHQNYRFLIATISQDLVELKREAQHVPGELNAFKTQWLTSPRFHFKMIGIVFRPDRVTHESCGETRFIFRLADAADNFLPMTVNFIFELAQKNDCQAVWQKMNFDEEEGLAFAEAVAKQERPTRVEINAQVLTFKSNTDRNALAQSLYLMRSFRWDKTGALRVYKLENTLSDKLDAASKAALQAWIVHNQAAIWQGNHKVPERFLAERVTTVTPLGLLRNHNRSFARSLAGPPELLQRLDGLSCQGCHALRSIAGFHLLGRSLSEKTFANLRSPFSAYAEAIQSWRANVRQQLLEGHGTLPPLPDSSRPFQGGLGDACSASQKCQRGLRCAFEFPTDPLLTTGQCLDINGEGTLGSPCDAGKLISAAHPFLEKYLSQDHPQGCPAAVSASAVCATTNNGFIGGFCAQMCAPGASLQQNGKQRCLAVPALASFSKCLEKNESHETCLAKATIPALMPTCQQNRDCRADYACVAVDEASGICSPPYFLQQLSLPPHALF